MEETIGMNLPETRSAGEMMVRAPLEWAGSVNEMLTSGIRRYSDEWQVAG